MESKAHLNFENMTVELPVGRSASFEFSETSATLVSEFRAESAPRPNNRAAFIKKLLEENEDIKEKGHCHRHEA